MFRPNINDAYIFTVIFFFKPLYIFLSESGMGRCHIPLYDFFFFNVRSGDDVTVVDDFAFLLYYNKFNFFVF